MPEKVIKLIGELALATPFLIIAIPTNTIFALILTTILLMLYRRIYLYEFHFDDENQHWCLISSYIILLSAISIFYMIQNYFVIIMFCSLVSLASSKIGYLVLTYKKLKEITPFYNMLKAKYELVDFSKMTEHEIYETCRLNKISIKMAQRLVLFYINGLTYEQIANEEDKYISVDAIRNCFNRARNKVKRTTEL